MKDKLKIAVVGLGLRGYDLLCYALLTQDDVDVVAVCDTYPDRVEKAQEKIKEEKGIDAFGTTDYKEVFERDIDAVLVATSWETHIEVALYAMGRGIPTAMEVGGAYTIDELWDLVKTQERTQTPFMFMENCCFDKTELMATAMARRGLFGKIVHLAGAYGHDLRQQIAGGNIHRHYRLRNYKSRNCENYPTHEIGPIAKLIDINRGNRFVSLVSVASKAEGLKEYVKAHAEEYPDLQDTEFKQGDIVTTIITCANGETVTLRLDTTLPRFYARDFTVRGTKGFYEQNTNTVFLDGDKEDSIAVNSYKRLIDNGVEYEQEYLPTCWKTITKEQMEAGHGGMDYFEFRHFIECLKKGEEPAIDVYDAATWMAVTALSEQSIALGGAPVLFPDFTNGSWVYRERKDVCEF